MVAGLLYALAAASDLITSTVALHSGMQEGNPIVAPLLGLYGILPAVAISAVICAILWWYAIRGGKKLVYVLAGIRWIVVASNILQLVGVFHVIAVLHT